MLGTASLHRLQRASAKYSHARRKRCYRIHAMLFGPQTQTLESPKGNSGTPWSRSEHYGVICISALAAHLLTANAVWSEVPQDELFSLQAAQPLTELSSSSPDGTSDDVLPITTVEPPTNANTNEINIADEFNQTLVAETSVIEFAATPAASAPTLFASAETAQAPDASAAAAAPAAVPLAEIVALEESTSAAVSVPDAVASAPAEPAVASPVIAMDIPAMPEITTGTDLKTLISALIENEQFIAALVNNEAFLDRLAGEDRVVAELARRKEMSIETEARNELATELRRRQQMMEALAARGEEAVLAVADAAKQAAEQAADAARSETLEADTTGEVGVVSSGNSALVAMETAVELLEDSQELLAAMEAKGSTSLSELTNDNKKQQREFDRMEAAVARAEKSVSKTLEKNGSEPLPVIQEAVRELYAGEQNKEDDVTINRAYTDLVTAVSEMQKAYGSAISKAVGHAVAEVVEVEEAALKGAEKTKSLVSQKVRWFGW